MMNSALGVLEFDAAGDVQVNKNIFYEFYNEGMGMNEGIPYFAPT